jgi:acyl dehydratase
MEKIHYEDVNVGDELPELKKPPVERIQLVKYAGASGDFNPMHTVEPYAREAGMKSVFAHGMLTMGFVGQLLTRWVDIRCIKEFKVRFKEIVWPEDIITCKGKVSRKYETDGQGMVEVELSAFNQNMQEVASGLAKISVPKKQQRQSNS